MAVNKATLAKEIDGVIEYIYPKTSADIVVYDSNNSVAAMIETLVSGKVDKVDGMGLSTNDFTTTLKDKLDGIASGATKITVDSSLSTSSANPVQNKVVTAKLTELESSISSASGTGSSASTAAAAAQETADEAKAAASTNATNITNLTTRVTTAESDIDALEARVDLTDALVVSNGQLCVVTA